MAYKFQLGAARLSGSLVQEGDITADSSALIASTLSASSTLNVVGQANFGPGNLGIVKTDGAFSGSAFSGSGLANFNRVVSDTAWIKGGNIDSTAIGANDASTAAFTTLSASGEVNFPNLVNFGAANYTKIAANTGIISSSADNDFEGIVRFGAGQQAKFSQAGAISSSAQNDFAGVQRFGAGKQTTISAAGLISSSADAVHTMERLQADQLTVRGAITCEGGNINNTSLGASTPASGQFTTLSASSQVNLPGLVNFGAENYTTVAANTGVISSSATPTFHDINTDKANISVVTIDGGNINNASIGASTQASGQFTTLSASSTLSVEGNSQFGAGALAKITSTGLITGSALSASGISGLHQVYSDQLNAEVANFGAGQETTISVLGAFSSSATADLAGQVRFGVDNQTTISSTGIISSSAECTIHKITANRLVADILDVVTINSVLHTNTTLEVDDKLIIAAAAANAANSADGGLQIDTKCCR